MRRWLLGVVVLLVTLAPQLQAAAMELRECSDPRVFRQTPVNVLILPYTYGADPRRPLSPAARQLTVLIQEDSLLEMVKYERIAIVNLFSPPGSPECQPEKVWEQMLREGVAPGGGLVMMWGRLYEEGGDLYVQSYLRFGRAGRDESVVFPNRGTKAPADDSIQLRAKLPTTSVTLPPRKLSTGDLRAITTAFARAAQLREEPNDGARVVRVSPDPSSLEPFGYSITETRPGGWMHVKSFYGGPAGWIRARVDGTEFPLRERMPELFFLDAVVGYLQYRVADRQHAFPPSEPPRRFIPLVQNSLDLYEKRTPSRAAPAAQALGRAMLGTLRLLDGSQPAIESALTDFKTGSRLVPYSAEMRNLANLARFGLCCNSASFMQYTSPAIAASLLKDMMTAVSIDPGNVDALNNVASVHRLLDQWPGAVAAIGADEVARQRAALAVSGYRK